MQTRRGDRICHRRVVEWVAAPACKAVGIRRQTRIEQVTKLIAIRFLEQDCYFLSVAGHSWIFAQLESKAACTRERIPAAAVRANVVDENGCNTIDRRRRW